MIPRTILKATILLLTGCGIFLGRTKAFPDLQNVPANSTVRVIVQYANPLPNVPSVPGLVTGTVSGLVSPLATIINLGGVVSLASDVLNVVVCSLPASNLTALTQNSSVTYVSADRPLAARLDYTAAAVNVSSAWKANWTGAGIGVAVIDSGVSQSVDLAAAGFLSRVVYTKDFTGGDGSDQYGHGTHVAGIVGANDAPVPTV